MGVGAGVYMYDVVVKSSRSLSHLLMSTCLNLVVHFVLCSFPFHRNKCSAVAEMGDHLATIDMGRKVGTAVPLSGWRGSWVPILHNVARDEAYLHTK